MKPKIKAMWCEALRSGKYKQANGRLRKGDKFCCLGVLCDIYKKRQKRGRWRDGLFSVGTTKDEQYVLPESVIKWAGLLDNDNPQNPSIHGTPTKTLGSHNDDGDNFRAIADLIEMRL